MAKTPNAPGNLAMMRVGRQGVATARSPAPASVVFGGRSPAVIVVDSIPPSIPQNLAADAISTTQIDLSWSASTDTGGSGLAGYRVYRNGSGTPLVQQSGLTFSDTNLTAATAYSYRVSAYDTQGNESALSTAASDTTFGTVQSFRFNPGHYVYLDPGSGGGGDAGRIARIGQFAGESTIVGVKLNAPWAKLEGNTQGDFTAGFALIDSHLAACTTAGKKFMLTMGFQFFGGGVPTNANGKLPAYLTTAATGGANGIALWPGGTAWNGDLTIIAKLWDAGVMNAYIAMTQAYGARYKDNPNFEMIATGETSIGAPASTGYTAAGWLIQLERWMPAARVAFPTCGVRVATNYLGTTAQMQELIATALTNFITCGGPDNFSRTYDSNPIYTGNVGGFDYRNKIPWASESQYPASSSGGPDVGDPDSTSAQIYAHNETGALAIGGSTKPNYYIWFDNSYTGPNPPTYHTFNVETLPFIRSINGACNAVNPYNSGGFNYFIGPTGSDSNDGRTVITPWAITALNTKRSTYSGKVVGLLDGTYNIRTQLLAAAPDSGFFDVPAFDIAGGTPGSPTIIKAVNAGQAIITAKSGSNYGNFNAGNAMLGHTGQVHRGYIEIDGLKITGSNRWGIRIGIKNGAQAKFLGVAIKNNEFFDFNGATFIVTGVNFEALEMNSTSGAMISNNYYHSSQGVTAGSAGHFAASVQWDSDSNIYEYNTSKNSGGAFFAKSDGQWGNTLRYNYIDLTGLSGGAAIQDFNGYNGSAATTTDIHHNILIAEIARWGVDVSSDSPASADQVKFWNNVVISRNSGGGAFRGIYIKALAGRLRCYNNIVQDECGGDHGMMAMNTDIDGLIDRNLYYSTTASYRFISYPAPTNTTQTSYSSVAAWKAGMGGVDANSPTPALPQFLGSGADALFYRLGGSSPALGVGLTNGDSGTACDLGPFGNSPPARIGSDLV